MRPDGEAGQFCVQCGVKFYHSEAPGFFNYSSCPKCRAENPESRNKDPLIQDPEIVKEESSV